MLPRLLIAAVLPLALTMPAVSADEWPLTGALNAHDPTLIKEGEKWWCFTTGGGLRVKSSPDGLVWTQETPLFTAELDWWRTYAPEMRKLDVWAPDIQEFRGRIWCYYAVSEFGRNNSAIGLRSCTSIAAGDWRDDGLVVSSRSGFQAYNAIDAFLAIDAEGNPWLAFGSWFEGIQLVRLSPETMKPVGRMQAIARREDGIEAPNLVYAHGYYYLFVSIDKCCVGVNSTYKIACGRAAKIGGPYLDKKGVDMLKGGGTILEIGDERWKGPGGQDIYQNGDRWIIARHSYDANNNGRPALRIRDLSWSSDFWPELTDAKPSP